MVRLISRVMSSARADSKTGSAQELWRMSVRLPWNFTFPTFLTMRGKTVCHYQNIILKLFSLLTDNTLIYWGFCKICTGSASGWSRRRSTWWWELMKMEFIIFWKLFSWKKTESDAPIKLSHNFSIDDMWRVRWDSEGFCLYQITERLVWKKKQKSSSKPHTSV